MSSTRGLVTVRKNSGADTGSQERLNLVEGANITLTVAEDTANKEIDVTIASAAGAGTEWLNQFYPAPDPTTYKGTYAAVLLEDGYDVDVYQTFMIPSDIVTIDTAVVIVIADATGNLRWECSTNFAEVCANEDYQTHTDSIAANTTAVDQEQVECIDISAALTGAVGDDLVGLKFTRTGSNAGDTVDADCYYIGVLIKGSSS